MMIIYMHIYVIYNPGTVSWLAVTAIIITIIIIIIVVVVVAVFSFFFSSFLLSLSLSISLFYLAVGFTPSAVSACPLTHSIHSFSSSPV